MAVPVRPADPAIVDLLGPGMHVAVIVVGDDGAATVLAADAIVLVIAASTRKGQHGQTGRAGRADGFGGSDRRRRAGRHHRPAVHLIDLSER